MANRTLAISRLTEAGRQAVRRLQNWLPGWQSRPQRQLRLCENLPLGERRFLSVVEFGQQKFLVGGTASSLAVLAVFSGGPECSPDGKEDVPMWTPVDGELVRDLRHD